MIGLSTYAFFWQHSERAPQPLGLTDMLAKSHALGVRVFQICDYAPILACSDTQLAGIRQVAGELGITLELGTRGIRAAHLQTCLHVAEMLDAHLVRSMVNAPDHRPTLAEAETLLRQTMPAFEASGVMLALETYEQISSRDLVALVEVVGSGQLGICLDPANCVAALEHPIDVIERCAPYVKNLHVKDFAFTRRGGWVGFTLEGVELGKGLLPYEAMIRKVDPEARGINRILEHWLTWQDNFERTREIEDSWNAKNLDFIRRADNARGECGKQTRGT